MCEVKTIVCSPPPPSTLITYKLYTYVFRGIKYINIFFNNKKKKWLLFLTRYIDDYFAVVKEK